MLIQDRVKMAASELRIAAAQPRVLGLSSQGGARRQSFIVSETRSVSS